MQNHSETMLRNNWDKERKLSFGEIQFNSHWIARCISHLPATRTFHSLLLPYKTARSENVAVMLKTVIISMNGDPRFVYSTQEVGTVGIGISLEIVYSFTIQFKINKNE